MATPAPTKQTRAELRASVMGRLRDSSRAMARAQAFPPAQLVPVAVRARRRSRVLMPIFFGAIVAFFLYGAFTFEGNVVHTRDGHTVDQTAAQVRSFGWAGVEVIGMLGVYLTLASWRAKLEVDQFGVAVRRLSGWHRMSWSEMGRHRLHMAGKCGPRIHAFRGSGRWPMRVYLGWYDEPAFSQVLGWFQAKKGDSETLFDRFARKPSS